MAGMLTFTGDKSLSSFGSRLQLITETVMAAELVRRPVLDELRRNTPVASKPIKGVEPGHLRDSIKSEVRAGAGSVSLRYTTDAEYAPYVVDGTGPHEITPNTARYLHWVDPVSGEDVFRSRVWHPGTQPNDFPGRTADRVMPLVESAFGSVFERF